MAYNLGDAIGYIKLNISDFQSKYDEVHTKTEQLDAAVDGLSNVFDVAGKAAAAAFAAVTTAATLAMKSVLDVGQSFEASMAQVAATMGMTAEDVANNVDEYNALAEAAKEMGATTKYTATQAADALNYLALAGYNVEESISLLPTILNVAAAGDMDLAKASDMVTDSMSALGLSIDEAASFTDKLAKTSQKSNTNVAQLGEGILTVGGTARSLAGGVTELDTALGILANNGIKAAEGGTALRQVLLNLTVPTEKAAEYMNSIGLSAYDAVGNMKPLNQIFGELNDILNDMATQQERDTALANIFDARQLKSARALLAGYSEEWDNLYNNIENSNDAAAMMAETMQQNLKGAITIFQSALEGAGIAAYDSLKVNFTQAVESATTSIDELNKKLQSSEMQEALQKISQEVGDLFVKIVDFAANTAIPNLINFGTKIKDIIIDVKAALAGIVTAIPVFTAGLVACNTVVQTSIAKLIALKTAQLAANAAMLANPYTAVAAGIALVVAAYVRHSEKISEAIQQYKELNSEYKELVENSEKLENSMVDAQNQYNETASANNEQINQLVTITNMLGEYADKANLTATELSAAQQIIEQLNEIFPENKAYIDDQVQGYKDLVFQVDAYTQKLAAQAELEAQSQKNVTLYNTLNEAKEQAEELEQKVLDAHDAYLQAEKEWQKFAKYGTADVSGKRLKEAKEFGMDIDNYMRTYYNNAKEQWQELSEAWVQATNVQFEAEQQLAEGEQKMVQLRLDAGEKVEGVYRDSLEATIDTQNQYARDREAKDKEIHADEIAEKERQAEEQARKTEKMWEDISELDRKWQLRQISSEEEYQKQRKELLESARDEYDQTWIKEYNKSLKYEEQQAEARKQQQEQDAKEQEQLVKQQRTEFENNIRERISDLEYRNSVEEGYTEEMMYKDMEIIRDGLDKTDSLYKEINKKIVLGRKEMGDKVAKQDQENAEKAFSTWQKSYEDLQSEAITAYSKISESQKTLYNNLVNSVDLYERQTKRVWNSTKQAYEEKETFTASTQSLKDQIKQVEKYNKTLEKLQSKGISQNLLQKILGMDMEEGSKYAESLNNMSAQSLKAYSKQYDKLVDESKQFSDKFYQTQIDAFEKDYGKKFKNIFSKIPEGIELVGEETIQGFVKGIEDNADQSEGALKEIMTKNLDEVKNLLGIHSPSTVYEEVGQNVMQGFINGLSGYQQSVLDVFSNLAERAAKTFTDSFNIDWATVFGSVNQFMSGTSGAAGATTQAFAPIYGGGYGTQNTAAYNNTFNRYYGGSGLTKADVVSAIKEAQPDGDIVLEIDETEFARVSRAALNSYAQSSGNLNLRV